MDFFLDEILEDKAAADFIRENNRLSGKGRRLADYMIRTGNRVKPDGEALALLVLAYLADYALARNTALGISREITVLTLKDVNIWLDDFYRQFHRWGVQPFHWLLQHYLGNLFRLGRLQFTLIPADRHVPAGSFAVDTHIPRGEKLDIGPCLQSFDAARDFFPRFYPEFQAEYFVCRSWMLDDSLGEFLDGDSNVLKFMRLWNRYPLDDASPSILERVFGFGFKMEALAGAPEQTRLQRGLKEYLKRGGVCADMGGYLKF